MDQFRVFLSAVSSEFGTVRDALANDLQSHDLIVRVQRSFRYDDNAETLLHKLRNYIETCHVVIFLIGSRSGAGFPTAVEAERFRDDLPQGITEASYTQWEMLFARHFGKKCLDLLRDRRFQARQACHTARRPRGLAVSVHCSRQGARPAMDLGRQRARIPGGGSEGPSAQPVEAGDFGPDI